jgi:radical SAM superfamily enzyme YgiQ (UPF0313 family)
MKSSELKNIAPAAKKKKILLINPKRRNVRFTFPHNGLATLAAILKKRGHDVLVVDYAFLFEDQKTDISFFINKFKPDIIGISIYTPNANEGNEILSRVYEISPETPLMVGGPHATLYTHLFEKDKRIDYIFRGEAELAIIKIVESAKKEKSPKIVESKEIVYKWQSMTNYPIMTSRGCPNQCSFCASAGLSYRRWRPREPEACIRELELAQKDISPNLKFIVFDDNPTVDKKRFCKFLDLYSKKIKAELVIVNTRADGIDDTLLGLLKKCRVGLILIGVEHAHPEVFKLINKGETLEQIEKACKLVKKYKLRLAISFIIGLPGDNLERMRVCIEFAKRVKADQYSINQICPYRYSRARQWFEENNAKLYNEVGYDAQPLTRFECETPIVETPDFTRKEREKAFYMFLFGVADQRLKLKELPKILSIAKKYSLYPEFFSWLPYGILTELKTQRKLIEGALSIYRNYGFVYLIKRYAIFRKQERIYKTYKPS